MPILKPLLPARLCRWARVYPRHPRRSRDTSRQRQWWPLYLALKLSELYWCLPLPQRS